MAVLRRCMAQHPIEATFEDVVKNIDSAKARIRTPVFAEPDIEAIYTAYQDTLASEGAMDFADIVLSVVQKINSGELLTLRQVAQNHGQAVGLPQMVGTPSDVADQLEAYFDAVGGDGFMISPIYSPGAIEEFADLVVPELQRRGRFRRDYVGTTQRDHLNQEV